MNVEVIARVCWEANRALSLGVGDGIKASWDEVLQWQRDTVINGVIFLLANPNAGAEAHHDNWYKVKTQEGWTLGPMIDPFLKQHPRFLLYNQLTAAQQARDHLVVAIVEALRSIADPL